MYKCTAKQKEVLDLLARGYRYPQIAEQLNRSEITIKNRVISFCRFNKIPNSIGIIVSYYLLTKIEWEYLSTNKSKLNIILENVNEIITNNRLINSYREKERNTRS